MRPTRKIAAAAAAKMNFRRDSISDTTPSPVPIFHRPALFRLDAKCFHAAMHAYTATAPLRRGVINVLHASKSTQ